MLLAKAFTLRLQDIQQRMRRQYGREIPLTEENLGVWKVEMMMDMLAQMLKELYYSQLVARDISVHYDVNISDSSDIANVYRRYGRMGVAPFLLAAYLRGGREGVIEAWNEVRSAPELSAIKQIPSAVRSFLQREEVINFLRAVRQLANEVVREHFLDERHEEAVDNIVETYLANHFPSQIIRDHIKVVTKDLLRAISVPPEEVREQISEFFRRAGEERGRIPFSIFSAQALEGMGIKEATGEEADLVVDYLAPAFLISHYANRIGGSAEVSLLEELVRWGVIGREKEIGLTELPSYYPVFRWAWKGEVNEKVDRSSVEPPYTEVAGVRGATYVGGKLQNIGMGVRLLHEILGMLGFEVKDTSALPEQLRRSFPELGVINPLIDLMKVLNFLAEQVEKKGEVVIDKGRMPNLFEIVNGALRLGAGEEIRLTSEHKAALENIIGLINQVLLNYRNPQEMKRGKSTWDYNKVLDEFDGYILPAISGITNRAIDSFHELPRRVYGAAVEAALYLADDRPTQENLLRNFTTAVFSLRGHTGRAETGLTADALSFVGTGGKKVTVRDLVFDMVIRLPRTPEGEINWEEVDWDGLVTRVWRTVNNFSILLGLPEVPKPPEVEQEAEKLGETSKVEPASEGVRTGAGLPPYKTLFHHTGKQKTPSIHRFLRIRFEEKGEERRREEAKEMTWAKKVEEWREVFINWEKLSEQERKERLSKIAEEMHSLVADAWKVVADRVGNSLEGQITLFTSTPEGLRRWLRNIRSGTIHYVTFSQMAEAGERPLEETQLLAMAEEFSRERAEEEIWSYLVHGVAMPFAAGDIETAKRRLSDLADLLEDTDWELEIVDAWISELKAGVGFGEEEPAQKIFVAPEVKHLKEKVFENNNTLFKRFVTFLEAEWKNVVSELEAEVEPTPSFERVAPAAVPEERAEELPEVSEPEEEEGKVEPSEEVPLPEGEVRDEEEWTSLLKFNLLSEVLQFAS